MRINQLRELYSLMDATVKIGTRGSQLALWQANWVKSALQSHHPSLKVELAIIKTKGDKILDVPLAKVGGKGLFVKEIEDALLRKDIDIAVHSMKDMPAEIPVGLCIGAVPERENPYDVLISKTGQPLAKLNPGACVGTSSLRRAAQILSVRSDLVVKPLRGNLDTRLKKLETEDYDAIILAAAGVKRLGLESRITEYLDENIMLPAVGQGALCIETRQNDHSIEAIIAVLEHPQTRSVVMGERAFLKRLEGGCQVPMAAHGKIEDNTFTLCGLVATIDATTVIKETLSGDKDSAETIGLKLAERLIAKGAQAIIETLTTDLNQE